MRQGTVGEVYGRLLPWTCESYGFVVSRERNNTRSDHGTNIMVQ